VNSAIYEGVVSHRRRAPVEHAFRFRLFMLYLDLDELPRVLAARERVVAAVRAAGYRYVTLVL